MKPAIALFVFILALGLSYQTLADITAPPTCTGEKTENCSKPEGHDAHATAATHAEKSEHKAAGHGEAADHHSELATRMNSLFPEKQKDPIVGSRPEITKLTAPKFLSKVAAGSVKLEWTAVENTTNYHVQVATDPNFKWLVANNTNVQGTSFEAANLEAGKRYFWRVASVKSDNISMFTKSIFVSSAFDTK